MGTPQGWGGVLTPPQFNAPPSRGGTPATLDGVPAHLGGLHPPSFRRGAQPPGGVPHFPRRGMLPPRRGAPPPRRGVPCCFPPGGEPLPQQGFPRPMDGNPCQEGCPSLGGVLPPRRCTLAPPEGLPHFPRRGTPAAQKGCPTYQEEVKGVPPPPRRVPRLTPLEGYPGPLAPPGREPTPSRRGAPPSQEEAPMGVMPTGGG